MKRILSMLLTACVLASLLLSGCSTGSDTDTPPSAGTSDNTGGAAAGSEPYKIGMTFSYRAEFFTRMETAQRKLADELGNVTLSVYDASNDIQQQINHVQTCANDGFDAMIVNLVDSNSTQEIINAAGDMPIVFVNRYPEESLLQENKYVYVGSDENQAGQLQAEYIESIFPDKKELDVVMLMGVLGIPTQVLRTDSVKDKLTADGWTLNMVFEDAADWDRAKAMDKMQQFLGTGKTYDVIIANNDDMALGALEALIGAGVTAFPPLVSIDANQEAREAIKAGQMGASVFQDADGQGERSLACAVALLEGKDVEILNWIPFQLVTKDNVSDFD